MSRASNHSKQLRKRRAKQQTNPTKQTDLMQSRPSAATEEPTSRRNRSQTRSRQRRAEWLKKRELAKDKTRSASKALSQANSAEKPMVRGSLQHVLTHTRDYRGRSAISEISREATSGGVIYRLTKDRQDIEILLVADHFNRWTIPKGHIEEGETAQETAIREIGEEAGVHDLRPTCWLGKIHFRYRRENVLVLMSTQIYLFKALGDTDDVQKEDWMNGIKWFSYREAVDIIAYRDIAKLIRLAHRRLEQKGEIPSEQE